MQSNRLAVLLFACLLVLGLAAGALAAPKINFPQTELVFNEVPEGKPLVAVFPFSNNGDQNLLIGEVSPSCGCTASSYDKITKPGQGGKVTLELDTEGITGSFRKTAVVATNDPAQPFITLVISGETKSRLIVEPARRLELTGCLGQPVSASAKIRNPDGKPVVIAGLDNPMSEYLEAKLTPGPGGKFVTLTLQSKAAEPVEFAGPLFLRIPNGPRTSVWVVVKINGAFTARPQDVFFGTMAKDIATPPTRNVLVKRACTDKLTVDRVLYNKEQFEVTEHWNKPGEELILEVKPRPDKLPLGHFEQMMSIQSGDRMFTVRLSGNIR